MDEDARELYILIFRQTVCLTTKGKDPITFTRHQKLFDVELIESDSPPWSSSGYQTFKVVTSGELREKFRIFVVEKACIKLILQRHVYDDDPLPYFSHPSKILRTVRSARMYSESTCMINYPFP